MEIIEGKVSNYKGHGDIHRFYGKIGEEIKYYFLDFSPLSNGNMIATTELVEAIDPEVPASHIGLVDNEGNVVIPLENKSVKPITGDIILVERLNPLSQNVLDAIAASKDTKLATGLVSVTNTCKNKVMEKLGVSSELVFHNQLSEASIFDINGKNLVNDEYFSYIGVNADKIYLGKNLADAPITEYSMLPPEIQANTMIEDNAVVDQNINVEQTVENSEEIKEVVEGQMEPESVQENAEVPVEVPVEAPVEETPSSEVVPENAELPAEVPVEAPVEETPNTEVVPENAEVPVEVPVEAPVEETPNTEVVPENAELPAEVPVEAPVEETPSTEVVPENSEIVNPAEGFSNIDLPDVPVVDVPVDAAVVVDPVPVEGEEIKTESIMNDEKTDDVDEVLNSLFGNIASAADVGEEVQPVEEAPVEEVSPEEDKKKLFLMK